MLYFLLQELCAATNSCQFGLISSTSSFIRLAGSSPLWRAFHIDPFSVVENAVFSWTEGQTGGEKKCVFKFNRVGVDEALKNSPYFLRWFVACKSVFFQQKGCSEGEEIQSGTVESVTFHCCVDSNPLLEKTTFAVYTLSTIK